jgi:predicted aspartyl protease
MTLLEGRVDYLGRPIVTLQLATPEAPDISCLIDTGFNRSLLMSRHRAEYLGFRSFAPMVVTSIATGHYRRLPSEVMSGTIKWFGGIAM